MIVINLLFGQSKIIGGYLNIHPFFKGDEILSLDQRYDWIGGVASGPSTLGVYFSSPIKSQFSIQTRLGYSFYRAGFWTERISEENPNGDFLSSKLISVTDFSSSMSLVNIGVFTSYRFTNKLKNLQILAGPSFYVLANHYFEITDIVKNVKTTSFESPIVDQINKVAVFLQLELSYSINVFKIKDNQVAFDIAYAPGLRLRSFYNSINNLHFEFKGAKLGGIMFL